ncbi:MAG: phosphatidate cytidylyltransferase [Chloroherpetonaceae bacterium]|nr:phosphatidate cytidylyltransferase [Chthonomonadaceae bacterium]MDW8209333.1 phosphatidate cytidylyltransferase [Chloroherpetonaceae bacterium]
MFTRLVSGIVLVFLFLITCFGGLLPFALGVTVLATMATIELLQACRQTASTPSCRQNPARLWNTLLASIGAAWPLLTCNGLLQEPINPTAPWMRTLEATLLTLLVALFGAAIPCVVRTGRMPVSLRTWPGLLALGYVGILFSSFVLVRGIPGWIRVTPLGTADRGAWLMSLIAFCVWATDTCAYLTGRAIGRRKLAPLLSPCKTIEGSLGGLGGAMLAGMLLAHGIHLPLAHGLAVGAIAGTVGQIGDLFESALKRDIGIKDFGNIIPGHGGVLDRFDSLLFVTPVVYCYLRLFAGMH